MFKVLSIAVTACLAFASAAEAAEKGVAIGSAAPSIKLNDQSGKTRTLSELRKERVVALVFYRSAEW